MHRTEPPSIRIIVFRQLAEAIKKQVAIEKKIGRVLLNGGKAGKEKAKQLREVWLHVDGQTKALLDLAEAMDDHYRDFGKRLLTVAHYLQKRARRQK